MANFIQGQVEVSRLINVIHRQPHPRHNQDPKSFISEEEVTSKKQRTVEQCLEVLSGVPNVPPEDWKTLICASGAFVKYRECDRLGSGGQAVVYKAILEGYKQPVALKLTKADAQECGHKNMANEVDILVRALHERIMPVLETVHKTVINVSTLITPAIPSNFGPSPALLFGNASPAPGVPSLTRRVEGYVMPLSAQGSMFQVMCKQQASGYKFSKLQIYKHLLEASDALRAVHRRNVVHGDLKPDNLMLLGADGLLVLADFGLSCFLGQEGCMRRRPRTGTVPYMAPEQILVHAEATAKHGQPLSEFDFKADIWAFGVWMMEMVLLRQPMHVPTGEIPSWYASIPQGFVPGLDEGLDSVRDYDYILWLLCKQCLMLNPDLRPTSMELHNMLVEAVNEQKALPGFAVVGAASIVPVQGVPVFNQPLAAPRRDVPNLRLVANADGGNVIRRHQNQGNGDNVVAQANGLPHQRYTADSGASSSPAFNMSAQHGHHAELPSQHTQRGGSSNTQLAGEQLGMEMFVHQGTMVPHVPAQAACRSRFAPGTCAARAATPGDRCAELVAERAHYRPGPAQQEMDLRIQVAAAHRGVPHRVNITDNDAAGLLYALNFTASEIARCGGAVNATCSTIVIALDASIPCFRVDKGDGLNTVVEFRADGVHVIVY